MTKTLAIPKTWTDDENQQLRELSKKYGDKEIAKRLGRTVSSVQGRRYALGIRLENPNSSSTKPFTNNMWTEAEVCQLRELSKKHSNKEIAKILGRTETSVQGKRNLLGLRIERPDRKTTRPFTQNLWTEDEIERLRELSKKYSNKKIAQILGRTEDSVRGQREMLGIKLENPKLKEWTDQDLAQLKRLVSEKKSNQEIAKITGRTRSAIQQAKFKNGLQDYEIREWTKQEEAELRELASEMTTAELAEHFNRDWSAVDYKCKKLGIETQSKKIVILGPYTAEEDAYIIQHARYMGSVQLGEKLGRTPESIRQHSSRLRRKGIDVPFYLRTGVSYRKRDEWNQ